MYHGHQVFSLRTFPICEIYPSCKLPRVRSFRVVTIQSLSDSAANGSI